MYMVVTSIAEEYKTYLEEDGLSAIYIFLALELIRIL